MLCHGVQPEELKDVFPLVSPWIYRIPRLAERYRLQDVHDEIEAGNWQLWIAVDEKVECAMLTTIIQYPLMRELSMLGIAGNRMKEWIGFLPTIENYARINACSGIVGMGARKGFAKMLPNYTANRVVLERRL